MVSSPHIRCPCQPEALDRHDQMMGVGRDKADVTLLNQNRLEGHHSFSSCWCLASCPLSGGTPGLVPPWTHLWSPLRPPGSAQLPEMINLGLVQCPGQSSSSPWWSDKPTTTWIPYRVSFPERQSYYVTSNPTAGHIFRKIIIHKDTHHTHTHKHPTLIATLFITPKSWKQPKYPLTDEWIKVWYIYTMESTWSLKRE